MNEKYRLPLVAAVALARSSWSWRLLSPGLAGIEHGKPRFDSLAVGVSTPTPRRRPPIRDRRRRGRHGPSSMPIQKLGRPTIRRWLNRMSLARIPAPTRSVAAFLGGELAVNRASVCHRRASRQRDEQRRGRRGHGRLRLHGGWLRHHPRQHGNPFTGTAQDTPTVLRPYHVTVTLKLIDGHWLVDSYVSHQLRRFVSVGSRRHSPGRDIGSRRGVRRARRGHPRRLDVA